ncbi:MAG: hypothetical protein J6X02_03700 [Bacilli bacterium]|nr:hypothetical protein [Bacilli bacterium]
MYCYKCGVKLEDNEKECPLCHSMLPKDIKSNKLSAYSDKIDSLGKHINFRYITKLTLLFLFLAGAITFLCNFLINGRITWSIYVIASIIYVATQVSFLYFKKVIYPLIFNLLGLEYLLFTIAYMNNGLQWYLYLVMPNIFVIWLIVVLSIYLFIKKKTRFSRALAIMLFLIAGILITTEVLIDSYSRQIINLGWSLYASLPILILSLTIFMISFNRKLLNEIRKRIFI